MVDRRDAWVLGLLALGLVLTHLAAFAFGWQAHADDEAERAVQARAALVKLETKYREQGERHAEVVAQLNTDLSDARLELDRHTTGRGCLSAAAVRVLNRTGRVPAPAAAPAEAPSAADGPEDDGAGWFATDRDVADALAECRTRYAEVSDQLNRIIDIEVDRTSR